LNNNRLNGHSCFTPWFHPIFSVLLLLISMTDIAPSYILTIIFCNHSGKFYYFIVDMIKSCRTDPNAFVKSIAVTTRFSLFQCMLYDKSFYIIPCSLHPFVWLSLTQRMYWVK
jgi:hypothetical protein